jgi:MYXO-CTERM domain-containing protein
MHKTMIMLAALSLVVPAAAQQTDPATAPGNTVDLNAADNATGNAPMNGLATDPAMAPGATTTDPAMAPVPTTSDPGYRTAPREDDDFPWGLLGLLGLAGLLGRRRRDDTDVRRDSAA